MKNTPVLLLLALAATGSACHRQTSISIANVQSQAPIHCPQDIMIVQDQPAAPAQLSITKAACEGNHWEAELLLKNIGTSTIAGIEIVNTEDYENKKSVSGSQSRGSFAIKPGASEVLHSGGGFTNGLSYGKPVGALTHNVFRITQIRFSDGTSWGQHWTGS